MQHFSTWLNNLLVSVYVFNGIFKSLYISFKVQENGNDIDLYAKIDNSIGLENIDEIISVADGIFLHCPNLSMEVGCDRIFLVQKIVLSKCIIVSVHFIYIFLKFNCHVIQVIF